MQFFKNGKYEKYKKTSRYQTCHNRTMKKPSYLTTKTFTKNLLAIKMKRNRNTYE